MVYKQSVLKVRSGNAEVSVPFQEEHFSSLEEALLDLGAKQVLEYINYIHNLHRQVEIRGEILLEVERRSRN